MKKIFYILFLLFALTGCRNKDAKIIYKYDSKLNCYYVAAYEGKVKEAIIPETYEGNKGVLEVKYIGENAFIGCDSLETVSLPNTITKISMMSFYNCVNLSSINLPEGLQKIETKAFYYCEKLNNITIPSTLVYVGVKAFGVTGITEIHLPITLTEIKAYAFEGCNVRITCDGYRANDNWDPNWSLNQSYEGNIEVIFASEE